MRQKNSQRTLRKNNQSLRKEKVAMSKEVKERENFRKEGVVSFKKEAIVRTGCYRRPSETRTEKGSFNLAMMRPLEIKAGIIRQRQKPD